MAGAQPSARLAELGITLPAVAAPVAAYVPAKQVGSQVWTSGQLPFVDGALGITGKVGASVTPEQAKEQARFAALNALAAAAGIAGGIDRLASISKLTIFFASAPDFTGQPGVGNGHGDFTDQPQVGNGASELMQEVFGEAGAHVRSAVGVTVLPMDAPVEIELVCELA